MTATYNLPDGVKARDVDPPNLRQRYQVEVVVRLSLVASNDDSAIAQAEAEAEPVNGRVLKVTIIASEPHE